MKILKYIAISVGTLLFLFVSYFFIIRHVNKNVMETTDFIPSAINDEVPAYLIPSYFVDGERFYIKISIGDGDTIMGFGDTGGGLSFLMPDSKNKGSISSNVKTGILKGIIPFKFILFSDLTQDTNFPRPYPIRSFVLRNPISRITEPYLVIPPLDDETKFMIQSMPDMEAFLGQGFFMYKSWTFDYINKEIWVNTPLNATQINNSNVQKIGFKKNTNQEKVFGHASMTIEVNGELIDVLFDSGATIVLSKDGKNGLKTNKRTIGGSFIAASIFERWRKEHPEWKYYPKADMDRDVIEVPVVKIGGYEVGPVLFATRPDENWSEGMIKSMDKIVKGAIGGSVLKYFKVTIDYNSELIKFEK